MNYQAERSVLKTVLRRASGLMCMLLCAFTITACGARYVEPTVIGRIVDKETKKPIQGAFIYGFYATSTDKVMGGRKFGEAVKSFMVQTDANGMFRIEGWKSERVSGNTNRDSPALGIYKPGYKVFLDSGYKSIRQWIPPASGADDAYKRADHADPIDWTNYPFELTPATSERERYNALSSSNRVIMMTGECGWEVYAPLLLAQHNELKQMIKRTVAQELIDDEGYLKSGQPHPVQSANFLQRTSVDSLKKEYAKNTAGWKCRIPTQLFKEGN
jgi:hypothetical protein